VQHWISEPPPEHLFEITESSLSAVSPRTPREQRQELLGEKGLMPSPSAPNLLKPQFYRDALPRLAGSARSKRPSAALVIPDYAVRMATLDFDQFPPSEEERLALLRFRLRKSVPFPIDEAQVGYAIQFQKERHVDVLVVAVARPILDEYESIFVDAGYRLGLVLPSCVAALRLCGKEDASLKVLAKAAGRTISVLLVESARVRLIRSLDLGEEESQSHTVPLEVILPFLQQTLAYAEDQIGQPAAQLLLCGFGVGTTSLGQTAEAEFGIPFAPVHSRFGIASQDNAGLLGLLERYAA
jgi:type IV pilus assembly protein PilM